MIAPQPLSSALDQSSGPISDGDHTSRGCYELNRKRACAGGCRGAIYFAPDTVFAVPADTALTVFVTSFAYRSGVPRDADLVLDMRFLRNPYYEDDLRDLTGHDEIVGRYIEEDPDFDTMFENLTKLIEHLLPRYAREGKSYLTIAFGCTGGRHRSVYMAERLAQRIADQGFPVTISHRQLATRQSNDRIG